MNPVEIARLAAGILNVQNLTEENVKEANKLLDSALKEIAEQWQKTSLASKGIIT
jgi:hypothetical protein